MNCECQVCFYPDHCTYTELRRIAGDDFQENLLLLKAFGLIDQKGKS